MSASDLIQRMIAAGVPGDLLADIALELGRAEGERAILANRRQNERDRKAKSREVTGCHGTGRDSADTPNVTPILDKESFPQTPFKEINPTPYTETRARKVVEFPCPKGVDPAHWCDFLVNRKAKRLPNTATAYAGVLKRIAEFVDDNWPPGRLVQFCVEKGWGSINDPRESEHRNGGRHGTGRLAQSATPPGIGTTRAAAERVKAQIRSAREFAAGQPGGSG